MVRSSHLSRADAQTRSSPTRQTRHSTDHPTNCQNKPNRLHQDVHCRDQNVHELYHILQEDMISKAKSVEMIHGNWEESYVKLPKLFEALQSCVPGTVGGEIVPGKRLFKRVFWSFGPCINGFAYCKPLGQVNGTWLYGKYTDTLLIATTQDGANHIFPIAYAIVEGETTSAWCFFLKNLRRHVTPQINISLISDRHPSIISAYNNPSNLWVQETSHFFCLCHIAQKFLRGNSNCKHLKKPLMLAGYAYTEKMH
ncbi:hypothetical protein HKD37_09G025667 [Glycine soja]